ncbi:hypothetical protein Q4610_20175 [Sphingobium sp. HBC34]|uniref:Lipo-like protein n=1 Tax=Sphingobium cyanobacteriorum TaxID=3063954 RepID=A0ABT8ZT09_9SPHN|nr:hypothetical protein [Sphingobium sp. HBC34]MDO7837367.1 hypothetical protein [Sphingobium sp. HBC34]
MGLLVSLGRLLAGYLTGPSRSPYTNAPTDPELLSRIIKPGDVLLVDGRQRISTAIKYLTQSTWSHAALCVDLADGASINVPRLVRTAEQYSTTVAAG